MHLNKQEERDRKNIFFKMWFGLVSLFQWPISFHELFNPNAVFVEHLWYYLTHSLVDKDVHTFPKGISLKMNV